MPHLSFANLHRLILERPLEGAQAAQQEFKKHQTREYELAASAYALAVRLFGDTDCQALFYSLPFFSRGYRPNPEHLLLHCVHFVGDARRGPEAERVGAHARAMQSAFDGRWSAEQVLDALMNRGGFSGLEASPSKPEPSGSPAIGKDVQTPGETVNEPSWDDGISPPIGVPDSHTNDGEGSPPCPSMPPKKVKRSHGRSAKEMLERYLMVDMEPLGAIDSLFGLMCGQGRYIWIERDEDETDGFAVFKGRLDFTSGHHPSG